MRCGKKYELIFYSRFTLELTDLLLTPIVSQTTNAGSSATISSKNESNFKLLATSKKWATASSGVPTRTPCPRLRMCPLGPAHLTTLQIFLKQLY